MLIEPKANFDVAAGSFQPLHSGQPLAIGVNREVVLQFAIAVQAVMMFVEFMVGLKPDLQKAH